ncbi:SPX domain [Fragilaria crotonensis]|nr:SPX domain [Fragilaria crotonensis]
MHLLRFICVNVIAVRKICRKHDRLLMNRMLGGYYHRKRQQNQMQTEMNDVEKQGETPNTFTLGGIVSRSLGDSNARQVFVTGINQNKLTGLYDTKIQQLANSNTVQDISSSIALALSEYEVSHSRADALAKLNSASSVKKTPKRVAGGSTDEFSWSFGLSPSRWAKAKRTRFSEGVVGGPSPIAESERSDDSMGEDGPPSTASTVSLTRLRFTVVSIFALREVARRKKDNYKAFISRSSLVFSGANVIGEGLDGCSREVLDFFVLYSPDAALLLDSSALYEGLQKGQWKESPIGTVMLSTLAMGVMPVKGISGAIEGSDDVVAAVSVMPISGDLTYLDGKHKKTRQLFMSNIPDLLGQGINPATLRLNGTGMFLSTMNYYITHSTATAFVQGVGAHSAHSALIIGAASFGALVAALVQLHGISREVEGSGPGMLTTGYFRHRFLLFSAFPIIGNILHALAVSEGSVVLAVFGRFLIGFGSAELLHRQLLSSCLPAPHVVFESANLVHSHVFGVFCGLAIGGFLALFDVNVNVATISSLHSGSYFMACCFFHWVQLFRLFQESNVTEAGRCSPNYDDLDEEYEASIDESSDTGSPDSLFFGSGIKARDDSKSIQIEQLEAAYTSPRTAGKKEKFQKEKPRETDSLIPKQEKNPSETMAKAKAKSFSSFKTFARLRRILLYNVGSPVTLAVIVFVRISHEMLFTSCAIITNRYFLWNGSQACLCWEPWQPLFSYKPRCRTHFPEL